MIMIGSSRKLHRHWHLHSRERHRALANSLHLSPHTHAPALCAAPRARHVCLNASSPSAGSIQLSWPVHFRLPQNVKISTISIESRGSCIFQAAKSKTIIWLMSDWFVTCATTFFSGLFTKTSTFVMLCESIWFQVLSNERWSEVQWLRRE